MITTLLVGTGTALLIIGLYPFLYNFVIRWIHNQIVYNSMMNIDAELEWIQGNG